MPRLVVDFADRRPFLNPPAWVHDRIRAALPIGWEMIAITAPTDGTADGAATASPRTLAAVADAEIYFGFGVPAEVLRAGAGLRWVHSGTAGVGASLTPAMRERDVVFTNSAGVHAPAIAETALAMILHFGRGLDFAVRAQARAEWWKEPYDAPDSPVREIAGSTVGIVGFGRIGRELADRLRPLGARILALKRRPGSVQDGIELVFGRAGFERILAESDTLVLTVPETAETRGLIDAAALGRLRTGALLVNVARGAVIDEDALVRALAGGRLRGAALDVFAVEPLPGSSPLWRLPNVLITPHVSGYTRRFWERETDLVLDNIGRFFTGRTLRNVVDKLAGY